MFNERLPAVGGRGPQEEEFGDENSGFGNGFHDRFGNGRGGRRADFYNQHGGGRRRDRHVHFDDEDEARDEYDEGFDDNENSFAHHGRFGQPYEHRRGAGHDGANHLGRRNRGDLNGNARIKLSVLKFSGREDADSYLEWKEQCDHIFRVHNLSDQMCVNLASVEFSGYALTWWNQIQENQLVLGRDHINTWAEMKRVMRRRFVPSNYQRDLRNRLQTLRQGSKSVDDFFKEMELLLVRYEIREDEE